MATLGSVVACSLVVGSDRDQCARDSDCAGHGLGARAVCVSSVCTSGAVPNVDATTDDVDAAPVDPVWGCLSHVQTLPPLDKNARVHFLARFQSLSTGAPIPSLSIKACTQLDVKCAEPYEGTPKDTDTDGIVDLLLYSGFRGYLEVQPSTVFPSLMPSVAYVQPIPDKDASVPDGGAPRVPTTLLTKDEANYFAAVAGKPLKPEYGHLIFTAFDCQGTLAAQTVIRAETVTSDTQTFYLDPDGNPSLTQGKTGTSGNGGYLNLPVGSVTVTLTRENGQTIASQNVLVRAGTITYTLFEPAP